MEIFLDSTEQKRIDLCFDWNVVTYETKQRRFVVKSGIEIRSFEDLLEAVEYYKSI